MEDKKEENKEDIIDQEDKKQPKEEKSTLKNIFEWYSWLLKEEDILVLKRKKNE